MVERNEICTCNENPLRDNHPCPHQQDMNENQDQEYCNCCDYCTEKCVEDI